MKLFFLTSVTMIAFAANSILTRMAVEGSHMDPGSFAVARVAAGVLVLGVIVRLRNEKVPLRSSRRIVGATSLFAYMIGFSMAYLTLDAGLGALILFGVVQITMFSYGAIKGKGPSRRQILGATVAFAGLLLALWPGPGGQADPAGAGFMVLAGLGWAAYSIAGQRSDNPLASTAANFLLCLPVLSLFFLGQFTDSTGFGWLLAIICGGLTSGLGYALWYTVLPHLQQAVAAVVQLSVPVLAILAGALILGETVTLMVSVSAVLVLSGIALAITSRSVQADRS